MSNGTVDTTFLQPAGGCNDPLIPTAYAVAFHRGDLPEDLTVRFREHEGHGGDMTATFVLPPYDGPPAPEPSPPPRQMDEATLDSVFEGHPVRRCEELPDPRDGAFEGGPSSIQHDHGDVPGDIQERYAAEHPDSYGWLMLDSSRDEFVIGVTDDVEGHRARLSSRHPGVPLRVEQTPYTLRELAAAQEALSPFHDPGAGPQLSSSGYFAYVELGLIDPTREDLDAVAAVVDPAMICVDPILSGLP